MKVTNRLAKAQKFGAVNDDSDDELEEESLLSTPLDKVEPYSTFKQALLSKYLGFICSSRVCESDIVIADLQQEQPPLYESLTKILNPDEQQIVQNVVMKADQITIERQAAAQSTTLGAAASQQQMNGGVH